MPGFECSGLSPDEHSRLIKSLVTPRPIGWISTRSAAGVDNLAPYSCFNYVNRSPPAVMFRSGVDEDGSLKDSPRNAIETGEFVVNVVTESVAPEMNATAAPLSAEESEFDFANVERAASVRVSAPRVADAVANIECTLYDHFRVLDSVLVVGTVEYFHVSEGIMTDGKIDMRKIDSVGRLGGPFYTGIDVIDLERRY